MRRLIICCALIALAFFATVQPAAAQVMDPSTKTQVMDPSTKTQVMDPSTKTQVMDPSTKTQIMDPPGQTQVMDPSTKIQVMGPEGVHSQIMDTDASGATPPWSWQALALVQLLLSPGGLLLLGALSRMFG